MRTYLKILDELGWPNIYLVPPEQLERVEGEKLHGDFGMSSDYQPIITVHKGHRKETPPVEGGLRGRKLKNVIYHEIAHQLWPHRRHWWIECFAEVMAGGGGKGWYSRHFGHSVDEMPSREYLLKLARRAVVRFNKRKWRLK